MKDVHTFVIKNKGKENIVLNIENQYTIELKPNDSYSFETESAFPPQLQYDCAWEVEQDFVNIGPIEKTHFWNVVIPNLKGISFANWEKEGF